MSYSIYISYSMSDSSKAYDLSGKLSREKISYYLDCVESGKTPETSPEESLAGLEVIWELYKAEDEHRLADFSNINIPF